MGGISVALCRRDNNHGKTITRWSYHYHLPKFTCTTTFDSLKCGRYFCLIKPCFKILQVSQTSILILVFIITFLSMYLLVSPSLPFLYKQMSHCPYLGEENSNHNPKYQYLISFVFHKAKTITKNSFSFCNMLYCILDKSLSFQEFIFNLFLLVFAIGTFIVGQKRKMN